MAAKPWIEKYRRGLDNIIQVQEHGVLEKVETWLCNGMSHHTNPLVLGCDRHYLAL